MWTVPEPLPSPLFEFLYFGGIHPHWAVLVCIWGIDFHQAVLICIWGIDFHQAVLICIWGIDFHWAVLICLWGIDFHWAVLICIWGIDFTELLCVGQLLFQAKDIRHLKHSLCEDPFFCSLLIRPVTIDLYKAFPLTDRTPGFPDQSGEIWHVHKPGVPLLVLWSFCKWQLLYYPSPPQENHTSKTNLSTVRLGNMNLSTCLPISQLTRLTCQPVVPLWLVKRLSGAYSWQPSVSVLRCYLLGSQGLIWTWSKFSTKQCLPVCCVFQLVIGF